MFIFKIYHYQFNILLEFQIYITEYINLFTQLQIKKRIKSS